MLQHLIVNIVMEPVKLAISHCYDPFSQRQTNMVLAMLKDFDFLEDMVLVSSKLKELIITAHVGIQSRVDSLTVLAPSPEKLLSNETVSRFCYRQFWSAVKLFSNAMLWYKSFTISIVEQMILADLLDGKILPFLRKSASVRVVADSLERIVKALSQFLRDSKGVPRALKGLHDFVYGLIQRLMDSQSNNNGSAQARERQAQSEKIAQRMILLLKKMNDNSGAYDLADKYRIKI